MKDSAENGIYYFLGNITNHILHALPLQKKLGGTFVVTSRQTERELARYNVPILCLDDRPYRWQKIGRRPQRIHEYIVMDGKLRKTYDFLNTHARVVIFYEPFDIRHPEWLEKPKKIFLPHGNMLKSYMTMHPQRLKNILHFDYMAALSPYMRQKFIADGVPAEKLVDISIARTDELLADLKNKAGIRQKMVDELKIDSQKPIILYAPTFWGDSSIYHTGLELFKHINNDYTLLFRPHPQTPKKLLKKNLKLIKRRDSIYLVDVSSNTPLTHLLVASDVIIIDRSSIALEALLTDTPLIFAYDTPKPQDTADYDSIAEVVEYSQKLAQGDSKQANQIIGAALANGINPKIWHKVRQRVWFQPNGGATEAVVRFIKSLL